MKIKFLKFDKLYNYNISEKKKFFDDKIIELIAYHKKKSKQYKKIISHLNIRSIKNLNDIPPIPITAFKKYDLLSIKNSKIFKTLRSSGTSGTSTSKIFLDAENSKNQTWVLSKIMEHIFGNKRLPMLVVEEEPNYKILNRKNFNARVAAAPFVSAKLSISNSNIIAVNTCSCVLISTSIVFLTSSSVILRL